MQSACLNGMLLNYIALAHESLESFYKQASSSNTIDLSRLLRDSRACYTTESIKDTPGYLRLSCFNDPDHFCSHWKFLWKCMVAMMTRDESKNTPTYAMRHISRDHFQAQKPGEDMQMFTSRLAFAYDAMIEDLTNIGKRHLIPHPDTLLPLLWEKADRVLTARVRELLTDGVTYQIDEKDIDLVMALKIYERAAAASSRKYAGLNSVLDSDEKPPPTTNTDPNAGYQNASKSENDGSSTTHGANLNNKAPGYEEQQLTVAINDSHYPENPTLGETAEVRQKWKKSKAHW